MLFVAFPITLLGAFAHEFCFEGDPTKSAVQTVTAESPFLIKDVTVDGGASIEEKNISADETTVTFIVSFSAPGKATSTVTFKAPNPWPAGIPPEIPPDKRTHEFTAVEVTLEADEDKSDSSICLNGTGEVKFEFWINRGDGNGKQKAPSADQPEPYQIGPKSTAGQYNKEVTLTYEGCSVSGTWQYTVISTDSTTPTLVVNELPFVFTQKPNESYDVMRPVPQYGVLPPVDKRFKGHLSWEHNEDSLFSLSSSHCGDRITVQEEESYTFAIGISYSYTYYGVINVGAGIQYKSSQKYSKEYGKDNRETYVEAFKPIYKVYDHRIIYQGTTYNFPNIHFVTSFAHAPARAKVKEVCCENNNP